MHDFKVNRRLSLGKIIFSRRRNEVKFTNCKIVDQSSDT